MYKRNFDYYNKEFKNYTEVLDLPEIEATFIQHDSYAMSYCANIDFITLIIPFGKANGSVEYNSIFIKNELVSYNKMYSEFYGTAVVENMNFIDTAVELAKRYMGRPELKFDELYPIAFINNKFIYKEREKNHSGLVFMGRLQELSKIPDISIAERDINSNFNFTNPHNKVIFKIVKNFMINYRLDENVIIEQKLAQRLLNESVKSKKIDFLNDKNIDINDYFQFKRRIVNDIKLKKPHKIIDIACGDDDIIYDFLNITVKGGCKVFANDIALSYIQQYHAKKPEYKKIIFTNFNAINAPFKDDIFDVLFCKNLLHHIESANRECLIKNLLRMSKQIVLVEILKYEEQNEEGKIIHKDFFDNIFNEVEDREYLGESDIIELLSETGATIDLKETIPTRNGIYYYIWISK